MLKSHEIFITKKMTGIYLFATSESTLRINVTEQQYITM